MILVIVFVSIPNNNISTITIIIYYLFIYLFMIIGTVEGGWEAVRSDLAAKYTLGGYPEMAEFILS